jgi:hypothetical protein
MPMPNAHARSCPCPEGRLDGPQPLGCISVRTTLVSKSLSVFEDKWRLEGPRVGEYRRAQTQDAEAA